MTDATAAEIYDTILPGWREAPRNGKNRRVCAPYRDDENPSLDIDEEKLTWYDRGIGEGGGAVDLARRVLGEEGARSLLRELGDKYEDQAPPIAAQKPKPQVEVMGGATSAQVAALRRSRRLRDGETLDRISAKALRVRWPDDDGDWKSPSDWLGLPTLVDGGFKLWALNQNGNPRLDGRGKLIRFNLGPVSFFASPAVRQRNGSKIRRLFDVEGESDGLACIDAGILHVVASTGGAGALAAHGRHFDWLCALEPDEVVIIRDLDDVGRAGAEKVAQWWLTQGLAVRIIKLPEELGEKGDLRDFLNGRPALDGQSAIEPLGDAEALNALADAAKPLLPVETQGQKETRSTDSDDLNAKFEALAQLSPVEYDRRRKEEAEGLGIRTSTLDIEVAARRPESNENESGGTAVLFADVEPWPNVVDGAELLQSLADAFRRFLALPKFAAEAMAFWVLHAHAHAAAQISPILAFASPEKRCGKTTALALLQRVVPRPLPASNITGAALFRSVEKWCPTILIDEADTFLRDSDELRGILNSGHNQAQAIVIRTAGEDHEPRAFRTWAPKAIALIGTLPPTLEDRAVVIQMRRRRPDETVDRIRGDHDHGLSTLGRQCARWVADNTEALRDEDPGLPKTLNDRAADNWRALVAIADVAGGDWPAIARKAAEALTPAEDETSIGALLLADIRDTFAASGNPDRMGSADLCEALVTLIDRPWSEIQRGGKPLKTNGLARRLKPFGIRPQKLRLIATTANGYRLADFAEAFGRYLPGDSQIPLGTPEQVNENNDLPANPLGTRLVHVPSGIGSNPSDLNECSGVPSGNPEHGPEELEEGVL